MVDLTDRLDLWEPRDHVTRPPWEAVKMIVINILSTLSFLQISSHCVYKALFLHVNACLIS